MCILDGIISPGTHFETGFAYGMPIPVKRNVIRCRGRIFRPGIDINEGIDVKVLEKFIGWDVIMCGIKADILRKKSIGISSEIIENKEEIFAVVTAGFGEFHHDGEFDFEGIVSGAEHIKSMPEIPGIFAAVQPPGSIGVRIMPGTVLAERAGRSTGGKMLSVRGCMGNDSGAVTG